MRIESISETNKLMVPLRKRLFAEKENKCVHCGSTTNLSHDHIIASSEGGLSVWENLQILCMPCNRKKGGKKPGKRPKLKPSKRCNYGKNRIFIHLSPDVCKALKKEAKARRRPMKQLIQEIINRSAGRIK